MLFTISLVELWQEKENINRLRHRNNSSIKEAMLSAMIFLKVVVITRICWCVYDRIEDYLESLLLELNVDFLKTRELYITH